MTEAQFELLREWVDARVEYKIAEQERYGHIDAERERQLHDNAVTAERRLRESLGL